MPLANIANPEWPPRSPHEVLLSTPSGRDRLRRLAERGSPSPSPTKRSASSASFRNRAKQLLLDDMDDDDDEEDEETLQLQLQEIQARLKLKKLQKKNKQNSDTESDYAHGKIAQPVRSDSVATSRAQSRLEGIREKRLERSKSQSNIDVPVSPLRRAKPAEIRRSPSKGLLGIGKGLHGSDISLKRAPSLRQREENAFKDRLAGPFLQRPASQFGSRVSSNASSSHDGDRPKTFNERIEAVRQQEAVRQERDLRVTKNRSTGFDIDHEKMETFRKTAVEFPEAPRAAPSFSREEILNSYSNSNLPRSRTNPDLRSAMRSSGTTKITPLASDIPDSGPSSKASSKRAPEESQAIPSEVSESEASQFEPFSSIHLSKRIIPHQVLTRTLSGKKIYKIPGILRDVKGPDYSAPDIEEDLVVFGVIARKSEPRSHQSNSNFKNAKRGKYMIMGLTDLKWEIDLFLFDSAFDKFWKLTPGTVVAILNPIFMPPPKNKTDTGKFSLTLNSNADTILEVGNARDLGFCKTIKKDGKVCDSWVDKRHSEFCDFHVNATLEKTQKGRMEINTMNFGKGLNGAKKFNSRGFDPKYQQSKKKNELDQKTRYDQESHSQIYIGRATPANLLDNVDYDPDAFHRGSSKEERMRKQLVAQEREKDLMKKLGKAGGGLGAEYMRKREHDNSPQLDDPGPASSQVSDATSLGRLGTNAKDIALSPIKRKRERENTMSGSAAMGWGSGLSKELGRMREGGKMAGNNVHVKKKTRFVTAKGIREAGRESIGGEAVKASVMAASNALNDDDDSDDLEIVP